jgi:hypothetical protein
LGGFGIESIIVKTGKINATRQEQFKRVTAKPPKPINTLLYFVSQLSPGSICQTSGFDDLIFSKAKPQGQIFSIRRALLKISPGGFVAINDLFVCIWFGVCYRYKNSLGEGASPKVKGLRPTGTRADTGKSVVICGVMSGNADYVKTQWRNPKISIIHLV